MPKSSSISRSFVVVTLAYAIGMMSADPLAAQATPCSPMDKLPQPSTGIAAVEQICHNSSQVPRIDGVDITDQNGKNDSEASLEIGEAVLLKTSVIAPAATYLDFIFTSGTGGIRARAGARTTILADGPEGTAIDLEESGGASFLVQQVHKWFEVNVERFTAAAPGTVFDVDLADPSSVTFLVSEGRVSVTRLVSIHLDTEDREVDQIRVTEYITATSHNCVNYARAPEVWQHFRNVNDARDRFQQDLQEAVHGFHALLEEDARWNLGRLDTNVPANAPTPKPQPSGPVKGCSSGGGTGPSAPPKHRFPWEIFLPMPPIITPHPNTPPLPVPRTNRYNQ